MQQERDPIYNMEDLVALLDSGVYKGLLQKVGQNFKFSHDRIRQACMDLVTPGYERDALYMRIGCYLMQRANDPVVGEDWMLFIAADHLNSIPNTELNSLHLANLNLQVGEKAVQIAAFVPASNCLRRGLEALERIESPWHSNYDNTLRLYRAAAHVELCLGDFERGSKLCQAIKGNTSSLKDQLLVSLSLAEALGRFKKHTQAMQVHQEALRLVKELPKRFHASYLIRRLRKIKRLFKKFSDDDILNFPIMKDESRVIAMEHLTNLGVRAVFCNKMVVTTAGKYVQVWAVPAVSGCLRKLRCRFAR